MAIIWSLLPQVSLVAQREHNDLDGSRQASALTDFEESLINNANKCSSS